MTDKNHKTIKAWLESAEYDLETAMVNSEVRRKVEEYVNLVKNEFSLSFALLYGSFVRGQENTFSDIDVALVIEEKPGSDALENEINLKRMRHSIDPRISPTVFYMDEYNERKPASFISEVLRTGQVVYKKSL